MRERKFAEAEPSMLTDTDPNNDPYGDNTVARAEFYESWGDATAQRVAAIEHYRNADWYFGLFASWSTSGGEGTARMRDVNRVQEKIRRLQNQI